MTHKTYKPTQLTTTKEALQEAMINNIAQEAWLRFLRAAIQYELDVLLCNTEVITGVTEHNHFAAVHYKDNLEPGFEIIYHLFYGTQGGDNDGDYVAVWEIKNPEKRILSEGGSWHWAWKEWLEETNANP